MEGLNICSANVFIKVSVGLKGLIGIIFIVGASSLIMDLSTVQWCFLLNSTDVVGADMLINYRAGAANQFGAVFKGVGVIKLMTACHTKSANKLDKTCQSPSDQGINPLFKSSLADICAVDVQLSTKQTGVSIP